jgi:LysM repeat protein
MFVVAAALALLAVALFQASPVFAAQSDGTAEYTVRSGDTLTSIADQYGLTVQSIVDANRSITDPNLILRNQVITLPVGRSEGVSPSERNARSYAWMLERDGRRVSSDDRMYLVRSGDTLNRIANAYGIAEERLLAVNPQLAENNQLFRGELIRIPYGLAEKAPSFYQTPADTSSR